MILKNNVILSIIIIMGTEFCTFPTKKGLLKYKALTIKL